MTRSGNPEPAFQKFGSYKWELDKELFENFSAVCEHIKVKKIVVLRHLIMEFVDEIRKQIKEESEV